MGDPEAGETLGMFARSLAEDRHPLDEKQTTIWLPEKSSDPNYVKTFPSHLRRLENEHESVELAEVFWGDQSRVCRGLLGAIVGVFQIIFGLRYAAYVAADQPGLAARWLKSLGLLSSRILHGPVLAVTYFLAILAIAMSLSELLWVDSHKSVLWTRAILSSCFVFALTTSAIGWKYTRSRVFERFWFWVNITAVFVCGLMLARMFWLDGAYLDAEIDQQIIPGLLWYCRVLVLMLGSLWFIEMVVLVGLGLCWFAALTHPKAWRPGLHLGFLLPALSVGIWSQVVPLMWLTANGMLKKFLNIPDLDKLFHEAIPLLGVQMLMCGVLAVAAGAIGGRFVYWRLKYGVEDFLCGCRPPRLIVHGVVQSVLALCTMCGMGLVFMIGFYQARGMEYEQFWFGRFMAETNKYVMGVLLPGSFLMVFLMPRMRPVFDIVLDVVNHFYFRSTYLEDALEDEDEFDISETTFEQGTLFFSRRDAIHNRMKRILSFYREHLENRPELIVVSHSQGTMIAVEVLNDPDMAWLKNQFGSVSLVTMGSPLSNLYQHYFRRYYPPLDRPFWSSLRRHVDRWVNVFRIDDPVGTDIHFPTNAFELDDRHSSENQHPNLPRVSTEGDRTVASNHPVGCRGHVSYWNDVEVLDVIRSELFARDEETRQRYAA